MGMTVAMKSEKTRNLILDALRREKDCTARQLSYELSIYGVWLSPVKVASLMHHDPVLRKSVTVEFKRTVRWSGLVYTHVRNGDRPCSRPSRSVVPSRFSI